LKGTKLVIYFAVEQLNFEGIILPAKSNRKKIPSHILATDSWDASLTNLINFVMMSDKEQGLERKRFKESSESDKKLWNRMIKSLHRNRRSKFNPPTASPSSPSIRPRSARIQRVSARNI
jgi:hypothetical protein